MKYKTWRLIPAMRSRDAPRAAGWHDRDALHCRRTMSLASVREHLSQHAPDLEITELSVSTATVALAAAAFGVEPGQIAKTLTLLVSDEIILLIAAGDARLSNRKFKETFTVKPRLLSVEAVERETGHPVGGVSPFGLAKPLRVYCDYSLRRFAEVLPGGGAANTGIRIHPERMALLASANWVDVTAASVDLREG